MQAHLLTILLLAITLSLAQAHYIPRIRGPDQQVTTFIKQAKQITIPFKKCFQVQTQLQANTAYINFQPSSLQLSQLDKVIISQNRQISVLQDLRTPRSNSHDHLIVFDTYALTFMSPNIVHVLEIDQEGKWGATKQIVVKEIDQYTRFKMYQFQGQAILVLQERENVGGRKPARVFLVGRERYEEIYVPFQGTVVHLQVQGKEIFTAEYGDGINCYSYDQQKKSAKLVASYSKSLFQQFTSSPYIVDINIQSLKPHNIIYALDIIKGVFQLNLTTSLQTPKLSLILPQPHCHALDSLTLSHLVLVCQLGTSSYIIQAYSTINQKGETIFEKLQPQYHVNYFNDLEISKNYFLVFSHRVLNVFWSSKQNNIPETVNTRSQIDLPGLESFWVRMKQRDGESYLYVMQAGAFKKFSIRESPARLAIKSQTPIQKTFKLSIFGNCQDLPSTSFPLKTPSSSSSSSSSTPTPPTPPTTCQLETQVHLQTIIQNSPRKQDFSVSASIIIILIVIFLLIIWICLKKYKGLQKEARKVLDAYKKKRSRRI